MNSFWIKIGIFAVIVIGLVVLVKYFARSDLLEVKTNKTIYDVMEDQDRRLRADVNLAEPQPAKTQKPAEPENETQNLIEAAEPVDTKVVKRQFRELSEIERIQAEQLLEKAIMLRKTGGVMIVFTASFKNMVETCRQIIREYPGSEFDYKARRILADLPERFRKRYKITDEEANPENCFKGQK